MRLSIFGLGYVGAVTAGCFANRGHDVIGVDANPDKCDLVRSGRSPIIEHGLDDLLANAVASGRLRATTDASEAVLQSDVSIVSVGTPSRANGALDLSYVTKVAEEIGVALKGTTKVHTVVIRSTVLPGTTEECAAILAKASARSSVPIAFNPEFLREGTAVHDFDQPAYTIIGTDDPTAIQVLRELYSTVDAPFHAVPTRVAELIKYTANAFHALKITFANEIGLLAKGAGVDGREVMKLIAADTRLNVSPAYLRPGFAYGGSCLPKDVSALLHYARAHDLEAPLLASLPTSNRAQVERAASRILASGARKIAMLGLAFKSGTDDLRESPAVELAERLIGKGCRIRIFDHAVEAARLMGTNKEYIERRIPHLSSLLTESPRDLFDEAEAIVVTHSNREFSDLLTQAQVGTRVFDLAGLPNIPSQLVVDGIAW